MKHRSALLSLIVAAACSTESSPDARSSLPITPADGGLVHPDAQLESVGSAGLLLNEVASNLDGQHDLVELLVTASGSTAGWRLEKDSPRSPVLLAALPYVRVESGQIIVVHLDPVGTAAMGETTGIAQHHTAANYDGAWDFLGEAEDAQYSNRVLALRAPDGTVTSAVPFFRPDLSGNLDEEPRHFPADLQAIIDEGLWSPACVPAPCSAASDLADVAVSWTGVGTTPSQATVSRQPGATGVGQRSQWQAVPAAAPYNSLGSPNSSTAWTR